MERKNQGNAPVICRNWARTGTCSFGNRCHFSHFDPQAGGAPNRSFGNPLPPQQVSPSSFSTGAPPPSSSANPKQLCRNWATTGTCKFGDRCFFSHAPTSSSPSSAATSTPPPTPTSNARDQQQQQQSPKADSPLTNQLQNIESKLQGLEISSNNRQHNQQQPPQYNQEEGWEDEFYGDEADDDFDEFDFEHQQAPVKDGSSCQVDKCTGVLQPHYSETGTFQYFLCSNCGALFTNNPGGR